MTLGFQTAEEKDTGAFVLRATKALFTELQSSDKNSSFHRTRQRQKAYRTPGVKNECLKAAPVLSKLESPSRKTSELQKCIFRASLMDVLDAVWSPSEETPDK